MSACIRKSQKGILKKHNKYSCLGENHQDYIKEYRIWNTMKRRCRKPGCDMYPNYGGRGIKVCDRWLGDDGFINFYRDMGKRPIGKDGRAYQIDRIDNNGDYCPENCRWVHPSINARNRSDNVCATVYGEKMCKQDICRILGISRTAVERHMKNKGEDIDTAILNILVRKGYNLTKPERII